MVCKAVIFDYIGTLVNAENYSMDDSVTKLYCALTDQNFKMGKEKFLDAYAKAHEKYRKVRYEQLKEVTNAIWVSEALNNLGFQTEPDNLQIKTALNIFFKNYIDTLKLREGAKKLLKQAQSQCKCGLISNFTYAPVIHMSLRKLGISSFFCAIMVSETCGWRKPSKNIFNQTLGMLNVKAEEAVYVGDSPNEDIKGAKDAGLKTVFLQSQFNTTKNLVESGQKPNFIFETPNQICENLNKILEAVFP